MERARSFQSSVQAVRDGMDQDMRQSSRGQTPHSEEHTPFWNTYLTETGNQGIDTDHGIAALSQILAPEPKSMRYELVKKLARSIRPDATKAIAKAAVFDLDEQVRFYAIKELMNRPKEHAAQIDEVLMQGIRYPMASVAKQAAHAIFALKREELVPQLVAFLGEAAPGDPVEAKVEDRDVCTVREVVRINHHRNCLLCHPPTQTGSTDEVPGVIPIPGNPFSQSPGEAYGRAQSSGEPMVRADTTYLRQDFSAMMPVENAQPWPEMQRFDFLVRTRVVEGKELADLKQKVQARGANLSENHRATVQVLAALTGHRDVAPTQAAWCEVIAANKGE